MSYMGIANPRLNTCGLQIRKYGKLNFPLSLSCFSLKLSIFAPYTQPIGNQSIIFVSTC